LTSCSPDVLFRALREEFLLRESHWLRMLMILCV